MGKEKGRAFIAMEYLDGVSLSRIIEEGPLESEPLLLLATEIADALDAAHSAGLFTATSTSGWLFAPTPVSR